MTWVVASPAGYALGQHHYTARAFRYLNWPSGETEWKRCHHEHNTRKAAITCSEQMVEEANKICGAPDCKNDGAVRCWYDDGKVSLRIVACLECRTRLENLGLLTVDRRADRPEVVE